MRDQEKRVARLEGTTGSDDELFTVELVRGPTLTKSEAAARDHQKPDGPVTVIELVGVRPEAQILPIHRGE